MIKQSMALFGLITALVGTGLSPVHAQLRDERLTRQLLEGLPSDHRASSSALTPGQAARQVQRKHGGEVLSVDKEARGYRVKLLVDGEVRFVNIMD